MQRRLVLATAWMLLLILSQITLIEGPYSKAQGARLSAKTFHDCSECPEMVVLPAGSFLMGSSDKDIDRDTASTVPYDEAQYAMSRMDFERPQHRIAISRPFALGRYLVTRGEFSVFVDDTGYAPGNGCVFWIDHRYPDHPEANWRYPGLRQTDRDPVVCVSWQEAKAYVAWLNSKVRGQDSAPGDGPYRLPSEAEWEFAARADTGTTWWWGDSVGSGNANCNRCGSQWDQKGTSPVGSFGINPFGLADVAGDAWELTEDCWSPNYIGAPSDGRGWINGECKYRVIRGGSWTSYPWLLRSASRAYSEPSDRTNYTGFRVAKTLQ